MLNFKRVFRTGLSVCRAAGSGKEPET